MRTLARCATLLSLSSVPVSLAHSAESGTCDARQGSCGPKAAQGLARESVLLQSVYDVRVERNGPSDLSPSVRAQIDDDDWMMELSFDHQWVAGGGRDDLPYQKLTANEKGKFKVMAKQASDEITAEGGAEALMERQEWRRKFSHEHQRAVKYLQEHPEVRAQEAPSRKRHAGAGEISGLYTFGAPGTSLSPLKDPQRADGKFLGIRCITQKTRNVWRFARIYSDPITFLAGVMGLKHPYMNHLTLPVGSASELHYASTSNCRFPRSDFGFWVRGHFQDIYTEQLAPVKDKYDPKLWEMLFLARAVDPSTAVNKSTAEEFTQAATGREARKVGWNVVAQSKYTKLSWFDRVIYKDNVTLFQQPETQACALAFVPTHHISHWLANLRFTPSNFCGLSWIHKGFRDQVRRAIRSPGWSERVKPALAACKEIYVTGHSLGAGQAQLVAACLQRAPAEGEDGWEDYKHFAWTPSAETARTLPALV